MQETQEKEKLQEHKEKPKPRTKGDKNYWNMFFLSIDVTVNRARRIP